MLAEARDWPGQMDGPTKSRRRRFHVLKMLSRQFLFQQKSIRKERSMGLMPDAFLEALRRPKFVQAVDVRGVSGFFRQQMIDACNGALTSSERGPSFKGTRFFGCSTSVCQKVMKNVRHAGTTSRQAKRFSALLLATTSTVCAFARQSLRERKVRDR
jgi:hypothetical protein